MSRGPVCTWAVSAAPLGFLAHRCRLYRILRQLLYYRYESDETEEDLLETDPDAGGLQSSALDFL